MQIYILAIRKIGIKFVDLHHSMKFHYIASQSDGKIIEGDFDAQAPNEALGYLASKGLKPISLRMVKASQRAGGRRIFGQAVTNADKIFLTKYLSLMLKVGTGLFKAINTLIEDFEKGALRSLLLEIKDALEKGQPFYTTFAKYPEYFSPVFINLVKAGETAGNLERIFGELSVSLQKNEELRRKITSALIYPILLLAMSFIIFIVLVTFALPKIANVFMTGGFKPPTFSKIVFTIGLFFNAHIISIALTLIILVAGGIYFFRRTAVGQKIFSHFLNKTPIISTVLKRIALQRFASTLSSLLRAGLPILDALEITSRVVGMDELKNSLLRISREGLAKGLTIGEAFRREAIFPRTVVNLVTLSETTGHLEEVLETLANFYESEIESSIKALVSILEPVLLLIIGIIIATIALAIIIPVYQ